MILTYKQTQALDILEDDTTEELLYGGAAGGAKSVLGCYWQLKRRFKYPGTRGFIGRASFKTLKDTTLKTFFEVAQMQGIKRGKHFDLTGAHDKENPNCLMFQNGSMIYLRDLATYPSDPDHDELGSLEITDAFIDECGQVRQKAKETLKTRLRFRLNQYGLIPKMLFASNPVKGWPYKQFYKADRDGDILKERKFLQALIVDNPHAPKAYVDMLRRMEEGPQKERLWYGNWEYDADNTALIQYDRIIDIFSNDFASIRGEKYITTDIARLGSDSSVVADWNGWAAKLHAFEKQRLTDTHKFIDDLRKRQEIPLSRIIADEDGVGGGIVDFLGCEGFVNNSRPLPNPQTGEDENYRSLKDQCYFRLADRINKGGLFVSCDDPEIREKIIEELEWVKIFNMDKDGKKQILPKEKIKAAIGRSPDYADTLAMREWFELKPESLIYGF